MTAVAAMAGPYEGTAMNSGLSTPPWPAAVCFPDIETTEVPICKWICLTACYFPNAGAVGIEIQALGSFENHDCPTGTPPNSLAGVQLFCVRRPTFPPLTGDSHRLFSAIFLFAGPIGGKWDVDGRCRIFLLETLWGLIQGLLYGFC